MASALPSQGSAAVARRRTRRWARSPPNLQNGSQPLERSTVRVPISTPFQTATLSNPIHSVTLAFEKLTPLQCCALFSRGVGRAVKYVHGPVKIAVSVPSGYREHLEILQETLGKKRAPYFGPQLEYPREGCSIWEGYRGIEEYAREVFPIEEHNNGLRWMEETGTLTPSEAGGSVTGATDDGLGSRESTRPTTPTGQPPAHVSGAYTPRSHPEALQQDFFVGSC